MKEFLCSRAGYSKQALTHFWLMTNRRAIITKTCVNSEMRAAVFVMSKRLNADKETASVTGDVDRFI